MPAVICEKKAGCAEVDFCSIVNDSQEFPKKGDPDL
jgi:hypothetical protein